MAYENYEIALISSFGQDVKNGKISIDDIVLMDTSK